VCVCVCSYMVVFIGGSIIVCKRPFVTDFDKNVVIQAQMLEVMYLHFKKQIRSFVCRRLFVTDFDENVVIQA